MRFQGGRCSCRKQAVLVLVVSTFPALTTYCSIVLGSLMIDLGKARTAEKNFPIARYRETTEWEKISRKLFNIIRNNKLGNSDQDRL